MKHLLDRKEAAEILRVHPETVRSLIHKGKLKASRVGRVFRILEDDITEYLKYERLKNIGARVLKHIESLPEPEHEPHEENGALQAYIEANEDRVNPCQLTFVVDRHALPVLFSMLNPRQLRVWLVYLAHANNDRDGDTWPCASTVGRLSGMATNHAREIRSQLVKIGALENTGRTIGKGVPIMRCSLPYHADGENKAI